MTRLPHDMHVRGWRRYRGAAITLEGVEKRSGQRSGGKLTPAREKTACKKKIRIGKIDTESEGKKTMRVLRRIVAVLAGMLAWTFAQQPCEAEWIFLGPTPYLSKADSPFPVDGSNPNFYLEDFEPDVPCIPDENSFCGGGQFDAPGVRMVYGGTGRGFSVDADDGVIDGAGSRGASAGASDIAIIGSSSLVGLSFEFDAQELGFFPTAVGFVLSDGAGPASGLLAYDSAGNRQEFFTWDLDLDGLMTLDDRFIGVINPAGISKIEFNKRIFDANPSATPRIGDLQYGLLIPEPSELVLLSCVVGLLVGVRCGATLVFVLAVTLCSASASAEVIRFQMTGTVAVDDPTFVLPADVITGVPFTAFLTYDTSVPDSLPDDPRRGRYHLSGSGTEFGLSLTVGSLTLRDDPTGTFVIEILDNASLAPGISPPIDLFTFFGGLSIGGPPVQFPTIQVFWDNPEMDSWTSDALPVSLKPDRFRRAEILAGGGAEQPPLGRPYNIAAFVAEVTVVPEPSTLAYFAAVAAMLPVLRWRNRRRRAASL